MTLFNNSKLIVIIGCGRLGSSMANSLSSEGKDVVVMDIDNKSFLKLSPSFGGLTMVGDGKDFSALKDANIKNADVVIVATDDDNTNIMISQILVDIFDLKNIITRIYDTSKEVICKSFNIKIISPTALSIKEINNLLHIEETNN